MSDLNSPKIFHYNENSATNYEMDGNIYGKSMPQSPTSAVSSETTSETQSVSDEPSQMVNRRVFRCRLKPKKQSKDTEKERPPWRSAITSTQPEPKRNALLKAKLLDATRRALLLQRISHAATQTESGTILMREKSIDVQKDLIQMVDKSEDTDGAITIRRDRPGGLIITQTVGQQSDAIPFKTVQTQTPLPRIGLSHRAFAVKSISESDNNSDWADKQIYDTALKLQFQRNSLKLFDQQLYANEISQNESTDGGRELLSEPDNASVDEDSLNANGSEMLGKIINHSNANESTFSCWDDFDLSDTDDDLPNFPRKTVSDGSMPWNNFKNIIIGDRVASMTLAPVHKRIGFSKKRKSVTWRDRQHAIIELLNETSTLIDIFAEVSIMLGPQIELNPIPQLDSIEIKDSEWEPKLSDSCDILEKSLFNFQSKALY